MEAKCGDYVEVEAFYDPRGSGTTYYRGICRKCNRTVKYSDDEEVDVKALLKKQVCPDTEVKRNREELQKKIDYYASELARLTKEYLTSLREHG